MKNPFLQSPDKPIVPGLEQYEVVIDKTLRTLTALRPDGTMMTRWTFTDEQRKAVADGADLYISQVTFGRPSNPLNIYVSVSDLSADWFFAGFQLYKCPVCSKKELGESHDPGCPRTDVHVIKTTPAPMVTVNYAEIEQRIAVLMYERGMHELLDKVMNRMELTLEEQQQIAALNQEISNG